MSLFSGTYKQFHQAFPDSDEQLRYYQQMEVAVRELLLEKGVFSAEEMRLQIEDMDARTPARGARVVARAWVDESFRRQLLSDAPAAVESLSLQVGPLKLIVVENTATVHNLIVCTLCSCYPRMLLGLPPDWYKSRSYRSRAVREPRQVLREFGTEIADNVTVRVHDSTADMRYMVLPLRPGETEAMSEDELAQLVTRDCMIGVTMPRVLRSAD